MVTHLPSQPLRLELKYVKAMRWLTLVLLFISIAFSYAAGAWLPGAKSQQAITGQYDSLFRPANYTFAIWGLIYLALLAYCVYQLLPAQAHHLAYERINKYLRFNAVMAILWQATFRTDLIPASAIIIIAMLVAAIIMFARAHFMERRRHFSLWITVPFSLYLAWLSVATVANVSLWLRYRDVWWNGAGMDAETWVVIMLAILLLITQSIISHFKDFVFPLVVAWAAVGIWVMLKNNDVITSKASLGAAVIAFGMAIAAFVKRSKLQQQAKSRRILNLQQ
jgi:hypothetical protein